MTNDEAIKLAEWLGLVISSQEWLSSPEGEVAMMDKLTSINKLKVVQSRDGEWFIVEVLPWAREGFEVEEKTRIKAIIAACLEVAK